ncbi:peptidoglycan bridge formation glycyltransferase FemA/FemB family protein [candidate division KSB1 bacterium]|nr:peptidoglycan bridge formation glycyltransferase FemA/FemB family protein [candidate division KSB1 bacterium]
MTNSFECITIPDKQRWQQLFERCRHTDLMQTWEYGQAVQQCIGWEPIRQVVTREGEPVAIAQILIKEIPVIGRIARIQHGPQFIQNRRVFDAAEAEAAIEILKNHWVDEAQFVLHLTPCLYSGELPAGWFERIGLVSSKEALWASIRIDLSKRTEELRNAMKRRWRNPLRKAEAAGLEVQISSQPDDLQFFIEQYKQIKIEKKFTWPSAELVQALWEAAGKDMQLLFAVKSGERIAGMIPIRFGSTVFALVAWNCPRSAEFHAHNFLIWQSILRYRDLGCHWFDLGGIDPEALPGITKFKRGLSGEEYRLIGNYESWHDPGRTAINREQKQQALGHILYGMKLPDISASGEVQVAERVTQLISSFIRESLNIDMEVTSDISLINDGLIDSLSLVSVIQVLQEAFDIDIAVHEVTIENFDKIQSITDLVKSKVQISVWIDKIINELHTSKNRAVFYTGVHAVFVTTAQTAKQAAPGRELLVLQFLGLALSWLDFYYNSYGLFLYSENTPTYL